MRFPKIRIPQKLSQKIGKLAFKLRGRKPDILIISGVVLAAGTVVVAIKDTWDNKETISEDISQIKKLKAYEPEKEAAEHPDWPIMTKEDANIQLSKANKKLFVDICKAYWKTAILSGGSVILIMSGKKIMRKQIVELSAMYASLLESYRRYRQNVIEDLGREKDQEYAYGIKTVEAVDSETGEVTKRTIVDGDRIASPYAEWLTDGEYDDVDGRFLWKNPIYSSNKLELEGRIRSAQNSCNNILRLRGWLLLNEARKELGFPPTEEGWHLGWVRGGLLDGTMGDDFVDFGVFTDYCHGKYQLPVNRAFLNPKSNQRYPLIDFNVICIDKIWNDIFEYDNRSFLAYERRKTDDYNGSKESLDRWFVHNEIAGE